MPPKTALLVIDMQNHFLSMSPGIMSNIARLSGLFTAYDWPQFFTQHGHPPSDFNPPIRNQLVRKWGVDGSIHTNTPAWEFIPEIADLIKKAKAPVISKNTYDAFLGTGEMGGAREETTLEERLKKAGVERFVLVGVMTDCCVDTTARGAFNRGYETWVVRDATASAGKAQHERGLGAWGFGYGDILKTEEVVRRLEEEEE